MVMLLALVVTVGPALGFYLFMGRSLKRLWALALMSVAVIRVCWFNSQASGWMLALGFGWLCLVGLVVWGLALRTPRPEPHAAQGLNPS
jgi:hypothetical protein